MIPAYPLQWPAGWPRVRDGFRKQARFAVGGGHYATRQGPARDLTVADGLTRVLTELDRFDVPRDDIVVSTNVRTRLDGYPRSNEPEPPDPGAAVYWQEHPIGSGARRVMAIDIYDRVADNLAAIAATLNAMRAIERHGGALILERAFTGFVALPAPGAAKHWREVLGVSDPTANVETAKRAYRLLAADAHPDRGGSHEAMSELNAALAQAERELRA